MNTRRTLLTLSLVLALLAAGCAQWIDIAPPAPDGQGPGKGEGMDAKAPVPTAGTFRVPVLLETVHVTQNGTRIGPDPMMERRALDLLNEAQVFSYPVHLTSGSRPTDRHIRARLTVNEAIDQHAGMAAFKGVVIGASMFLLTPLIPFTYDYAAEMTLDVERWDGQTKRYTVSSAGTASFHLFGATRTLVPELKAQVREACFADLKRQLAGQADFFASTRTAALQ